MQKLFEEINSKYKIRFYKGQKERFRSFMISKFKDLGYEKIKVDQFKNIIVGDINNAKQIYTAHYDTPMLSFYITPLAFIFGQFLGQVVSILILVALIFISIPLFFITYIVMMGLMALPNPNNANDNTSGVLSVYELAKRLKDKEDVAFILFNNEEWGLLGSQLLNKTYKANHPKPLDAVIFNIDCIGLGNRLLILYKGDITKNLDISNYNSHGFKKVTFKKGSMLYGSDYLSFNNSLMFTVSKKSLILGEHLPHIHMPYDKKLDFDLMDKVISIIEDINY